jgi:hypothetical protein
MRKSVLFIAVLLCGCGFAAELSTGTDAAPEAAVTITTGPVALPDTLSFAGEAVPLQHHDVRESLQREMLTTIYMHARTTLALLAVERMKAIVCPIMRREGLPDDFFYLCMAESGLSAEALSTAGAGGLWQFMPKVGESYGLIVNKDIDERYHIEKATAAACKYLKDAYRQFCSWTLAAASYNVGLKGVSQRMEAQRMTSYYDMYFPQETMRYMFRILSFKLLCADPSRYGFVIPEGEHYKPYGERRTVEVSGREIDWSMTAIANGANYKQLRELNPWIRAYAYKNDNGQRFTVKIPAWR